MSRSERPADTRDFYTPALGARVTTGAATWHPATYGPVGGTAAVARQTHRRFGCHARTGRAHGPRLLIMYRRSASPARPAAHSPTHTGTATADSSAVLRRQASAKQVRGVKRHHGSQRRNRPHGAPDSRGGPDRADPAAPPRARTTRHWRGRGSDVHVQIHRRNWARRGAPRARRRLGQFDPQEQTTRRIARQVWRSHRMALAGPGRY